MTTTNETPDTPPAMEGAEAVAWRWRQFHSGRWWEWNGCWDQQSLSDTSPKWRALAEQMPNEIQVRPLFATPPKAPIDAPDGMVLVPKEPTTAMLIADPHTTTKDARRIYQAMLAASQSEDKP